MRSAGKAFCLSYHFLCQQPDHHSRTAVSTAESVAHKSAVVGTPLATHKSLNHESSHTNRNSQRVQHKCDLLDA